MGIKTVIDVRDLVLKKLNEDDRTLTWLHRKSGIPYSTLYGILKHRISKFNKVQLSKVNKVLGTDFKLPE